MAELGGGHAATAREIVALLADAPADDVEKLAQRYAEDPRKQVRTAVQSAVKRARRELAERDRVRQLYAEQERLGGTGMVVGIDEVGRGAIAGPLTVCAVALPLEPMVWGLNDSKQLTPAKREAVAARVAEVATAIGLAHIEPAAIDAVGMGTALRMAMAQALQDCGVEPDVVLIDGNPVHVHPRERCVVKGDARIACISAASVVAKVTRDEMMVAYDADYPQYHLAQCKGYGSPEHIAAIREHGLSPIHRVSFCGSFLETPRLF